MRRWSSAPAHHALRKPRASGSEIVRPHRPHHPAVQHAADVPVSFSAAGVGAMTIPRVAFFTDSFHEVNGVALTSREFARFARDRRYPFFSVHAGPETRAWSEGSFETFELKNSPAVLQLDTNLAFDLLFFRHFGRLRAALKRFQPDLVHVTGPGHCGILGAALAYQLGVPLAASWHTNLHEFAARRLTRILRFFPIRLRSALCGVAER